MTRLLVATLAVVLGFSSRIVAAPKAFLAGADISMLPELEKAGAIYKRNGTPGDAIQILRDVGRNFFRVRLFVEPSKDFNTTYGATQDLPTMIALAKRIKASGATLSLDLHYSDYWADPGKQNKPKAWASLDHDGLVRQVHDYTADMVKQFDAAGARPDMVQVGNEITSGILWPEGKVLDASDAEKPVQWRRFSELLNAGSRAVREASTPERPIRVVLHIHGGGRPGLPQWFFRTLAANPVDFDIAAVSSYPAWTDALPALKTNLEELVRQIDKDVMVAETSYPWREMEVRNRSAMGWPTTPQGQAQFIAELGAVLKAVPNQRGIGLLWWYAEAIPVRGLHIWRDGAEGMFNADGEALPVLDEFKKLISAPE